MTGVTLMKHDEEYEIASVSVSVCAGIASGVGLDQIFNVMKEKRWRSIIVSFVFCTAVILILQYYYYFDQDLLSHKYKAWEAGLFRLHPSLSCT